MVLCDEARSNVEFWLVTMSNLCSTVCQVNNSAVDTWQVCFCHAGHSLGGGVATLAYLHLVSDRQKYGHLHKALAKGAVYTFGCPNVVSSEDPQQCLASDIENFCRRKLKMDM